MVRLVRRRKRRVEIGEKIPGALEKKMGAALVLFFVGVVGAAEGINTFFLNQNYNKDPTSTATKTGVTFNLILGILAAIIVIILVFLVFYYRARAAAAA